MRAMVEKKEVFKPITIVIETEAEARAMWNRLNIPDDEVRQLCRGTAIGMAGGYKMWREFNEVYDPMKRSE